MVCLRPWCVSVINSIQGLAAFDDKVQECGHLVSGAIHTIDAVWEGKKGGVMFGI